MASIIPFTNGSAWNTPFPGNGTSPIALESDATQATYTSELNYLVNTSGNVNIERPQGSAAIYIAHRQSTGNYNIEHGGVIRATNVAPVRLNVSGWPVGTNRYYMYNGPDGRGIPHQSWMKASPGPLQWAMLFPNALDAGGSQVKAYMEISGVLDPGASPHAVNGSKSHPVDSNPGHPVTINAGQLGENRRYWSSNPGGYVAAFTILEKEMATAVSAWQAGRYTDAYIPHAIGFKARGHTQNTWVWPATWTDGTFTYGQGGTVSRVSVLPVGQTFKLRGNYDIGAIRSPDDVGVPLAQCGIGTMYSQILARTYLMFGATLVADSPYDFTHPVEYQWATDGTIQAGLRPYSGKAEPDDAYGRWWLKALLSKLIADNAIQWVNTGRNLEADTEPYSTSTASPAGTYRPGRTVAPPVDDTPAAPTNAVGTQLADPDRWVLTWDAVPGMPSNVIYEVVRSTNGTTYTVHSTHTANDRSMTVFEGGDPTNAYYRVRVSSPKLGHYSTVVLHNVSGDAVDPNAPVEKAQGKAATASSTQTAGTGPLPSYEPGLAVDGANSTRWASQATEGASWWQVDLGSQTAVERVEILWESQFATSYRVQTSPDGTTWTTQGVTRTGLLGTTIATFPSVTARHVRIALDAKAVSGGAYSFWEVRVYGVGVTGAPGKVLGVTVSNVGESNGTGQAQLSWNAVTSATGYEVFTGASNTGPWTSRGIYASSPRVITGLPFGTLYFSVIAQNASGAGERSNAVSANIRANMTAPTSVTYNRALNNVVLTWNPNPSSEAVEVYRVYIKQASNSDYGAAIYNGPNNTFTLSGYDVNQSYNVKVVPARTP